MNNEHARRKFLKYLAASPVIASQFGLGTAGSLLSGQALGQILEDSDYIPASAAAAVNIFDMERAARSSLSRAHWTYLSQGVEDEFTLRANRDGFGKIKLRSRRLIDVSTVDTATELFGMKMHSPILLSPIGVMGSLHEFGEVEVARGARVTGHKQILSTVASNNIGTVSEALGEPAWFQLYPTMSWDLTLALVRRAEAAGSPVLFLTVDVPARNQDRMRRFDRSAEECTECHDFVEEKGNFTGLNRPAGAGVFNPGMNWDFVRRLKDSTSMKLVLKGITAGEDAALCLENGVDGILVSNHGGRAEESGVGTIESLPEVVAAVQGRIPVLLDGGIRRGTDIIKALALGADAVCVGRPYAWGLSAFGQDGVTQVMRILDRELQISMQQFGARTIAEITREIIRN